MAVLRIPVELQQMYDSDPEVFLRDIANFPQETVLRYFKSVKNIYKSVKRSITNSFDFDTHEFNKDFKCNSPYSRYLHFDLSLGGDLCAFSMAHAPSFVEVNRLEQGNLVSYKLPYICVDFVGIMLVGAKEEVWLPRIPEIVSELSDRGFPISLITFDRFQSAYIMQLLKDEGYLTDILSIDRTSHKVLIDMSIKDNPIKRESTKGNYLAAMASLRDAVLQERIEIPYHKAVRIKTAESQFEVEAKAAQYYPDKKKVDHGSGGTIDLLQAVAGAVFNVECNERSFVVDDDLLRKAGDTFYSRLYSGFKETEDFGRGGSTHESYLG